MKKGSTKLADPDLRRLRALMMLDYKLKNNATDAAVAAHFNVSLNTVRRALSHAKRAELVVEYEDKLMSELMPKAHAAILEALQDPDQASTERAKIALQLFKGVMPGFKKSAPQAPGAALNELDSYIEQYRTGLGLAEGEVIPSGGAEGEPQRLIEAATTELAPQGPDESNRGNPTRDDAPETSPQTMGLGVDERTPEDDGD